jgi:hypothetical protein
MEIIPKSRVTLFLSTAGKLVPERGQATGDGVLPGMWEIREVIAVGSLGHSGTWQTVNCGSRCRKRDVVWLA